MSKIGLGLNFNWVLRDMLLTTRLSPHLLGLPTFDKFAGNSLMGFVITQIERSRSINIIEDIYEISSKVSIRVTSKACIVKITRK